MSGGYRILDDVAIADVAFDATGDTPTELCRVAGQAVMELMADPGTIPSTWSRTLELQADSLDELLFEWLNRLVYLKDACAVVYHAVVVSVTAPSSASEAEGSWRLHATVSGAPVDPATQTLRDDIKAVTKHLYAVTRDAAGYHARVVVDV